MWFYCACLCTVAMREFQGMENVHSANKEKTRNIRTLRFHLSFSTSDFYFFNLVWRKGFFTDHPRPPFVFVPKIGNVQVQTLKAFRVFCDSKISVPCLSLDVFCQTANLYPSFLFATNHGNFREYNSLFFCRLAEAKL